MDSRCFHYFTFSFFALIISCSALFGQEEVELRKDGIVVPRIESDSTDNPTLGQVIYDINTGKIVFYNGSTWKGISPWSLVGSNPYIENGFVGIGTNSPDQSLHIHRSGVATQDYLRMTHDVEDNIWKLGMLGPNSSDPGSFFIRDDTPIRLIIDSQGNVGIGDTSPEAKLDISDSDKKPLSNLTDRDHYHLMLGGTGGPTGGAGLAFTIGDIAADPIKAAIITNGNNLTFWNLDGSNLNENMRISDKGKVGIGTTQPNRKLSVRDVNHQIEIVDSQNEKTWTLTTVNDLGLAFYEDGSDARMIIESGGNVGIGTNNPSSLLNINAGASGDAELIIEADTDNQGSENDNPMITFKQDNNAVNGFIGFEGDPETRSTGTLENAMIIGSEDNTPSLQMITDDEVRMTVEKDGNIGIGTSTPSADLHIKQRTAITPGLTIENDGNSESWSFEVGVNDLIVHYNGTMVGKFDDATGNYFPSDRRLKNSIERLNEGYLKKVRQLQPSTYYYNHTAHPDRKEIGFIAQDVEEIFPELISSKAEESEYLMLKYNDFIPILTKALQELSVKVEQQERIIEEQGRRLRELEQFK